MRDVYHFRSPLRQSGYVQRIFNPDGEVASAAAAAKGNIPYIMSTASSTSIEDVAKANGNGVRWYQLYWLVDEHNEITLSILSRAKKAGFSALVVTLVTYVLGWRPSDMDNGYVISSPKESLYCILSYVVPSLKSRTQLQSISAIRQDWRCHWLFRPGFSDTTQRTTRGRDRGKPRGRSSRVDENNIPSLFPFLG